MVYAQSLKYPYTSAKDLFMAYVLLAVPFLNVLSGLFVGGYLVHAAQNVRQNQAVLPRFERGGHLFVDGLKSFLIVLVYAVPALLSLSLLFLNRVAGVAVATLLGVTALFVLPAALVAFSESESVRRALDVRHVFGAAFSGSMVIAWLVAILVGILYLAAGIVLALFTQVTYIGPYLSMALAVMLIFLTVTPLFVHAYQKN